MPHEWLDDDAGPVVRPYTLTGGRVRATGGFDLVAYVLADRDAQPAAHHDLHPEHRRLVALAARPVPVAELATGPRLGGRVSSGCCSVIWWTGVW